ncbi:MULTISPECIES: AsnC family protein [Curtobacterium]|uniref:AsnC family protein n=1 Tax=Curtobacterium TaxID=2034 RepID=UPI00217F00A3|nr:hypothetical protein [Curtobacterium flaccumfaciens]MCS6582329.1 hypothetical protein [Curtobacterium flaccumfaciens pv. beticola]
MSEQQDMTFAQIGDVLGVSRTTVHRTLAKHTEVMSARRTKPSPSMERPWTRTSGGGSFDCMSMTRFRLPSSSARRVCRLGP